MFINLDAFTQEKINCRDSVKSAQLANNQAHEIKID